MTKHEPALKPILGLRTIVYRVSDLKAATEWYSKVLETRPYFEEPFYVGFNVGGYELGLDPDVAGATQGNSVVAYWGVLDADSALKRLVDAGAKVAEPVKDVGAGIRVAEVVDPFGNNFGIIENPHFGKNEPPH